MCPKHYGKWLRDVGRIEPPTGTYTCWISMRQRCLNPRHPAYPRYGERGITVCERWNVYANFLADMGERPDGLTLERKDNNGPYSPDNCVWADRQAQQNNLRTNLRLEYQGQTYTLAQLARKARINASTLRSRIVRRGWSIAAAVNTPVPGGAHA